MRAQGDNVFRKFANHVTARNPGGQIEGLSFGVRPGNVAGNAKQMGSGIVGGDGVANFRRHCFPAALCGWMAHCSERKVQSCFPPSTEKTMPQIFIGSDGNSRCVWCAATPQYLAYHDTEWGWPVDEDRRLFEKLCLEGFQAGLSWRTILEKRENFRKAFDRFEFERVAEFSERDVEGLLQDAGIIRHRGKIEAVINNARCAREMVKTEGSLAAFFWRYEPAGQNPNPGTASTSPESVAMSKELKRRGWKFVGPTTMYSFMQAMGLVNDHAEGCMMRARMERARQELVRAR